MFTLEPTQPIRCEPSLNQFRNYLFKKILSGKQTALSFLPTQCRLAAAIMATPSRAAKMCEGAASLLKPTDRWEDGQKWGQENVTKGCGVVLETM